MRSLVELHGCMNVPAITQPWEWSITGPDVVPVAVEVDQLGFNGICVPEHFLRATQHVELSGNHCLDDSTAKGVIPGATTKVTMSSMLTILPLHHPIEMAKGAGHPRLAQRWTCRGDIRRGLAGRGVRSLRRRLQSSRPHG
jgi:hypothetical protein